MNKKIAVLSPAVLLLSLSGCSTQTGIRTIYGIAALLAAVMLGIYCLTSKKKSPWFMLLFCSILVVNTGYWLLSLSTTLSAALWSNRLAYLGSVFLPLSILMIVLNAAKIRYAKWLSIVLLSLAGVVFFITATPGWLPIYYKDASLEVVNGVTHLKKVYGPLHCMYLFYLLGYLGAMLSAIIYVNVKKKLPTPTQALALTVAVIVNFGVWAIEQLVDLDFEILSLSYIICEMFLLVFARMQQEYELLKTQITSQNSSTVKLTHITTATKEQLQLFRSGIDSLTQTEKLIFNYYTEGKTTKQIMELLSITENTLKFHNKNIYGKLGINSRKQLLELYRQLEN